VLLGWAFAGETLGGRVLFAGVLTLVSIFLISRGTGQHSQVVTQRAEEAA
jgi:drug/metabolite transporter (DMT)-like permease